MGIVAHEGCLDWCTPESQRKLLPYCYTNAQEQAEACLKLLMMLCAFSTLAG